jgi:uncharacterized protein YbjT (DUF2867 family)
MARALIVACGCRGRLLGSALLAEGWQVRGTTRDPAALEAIEAAGIEPALADPDRAMTILDLVGDVTLIYWLLGSAVGESDRVGAVHGPRLERVLEEIVDTPVRGFVYEAAGSLDRARREDGAAIVRAAGERWRIPFALVDCDPADWRAWRKRMVAAAGRLTG